MEIRNNYNNFNVRNNYNSSSFKGNEAGIEANKALAKSMRECGRDLEANLEVVNQKPSFAHKQIAKVFGYMIPISEKIRAKKDITDVVNYGNVAKELVCMVVYPLQVLTNPDLPTDKKRFVGMYDFFVTCFSLAGTVLFAWRGTPLMKKGCEKLLDKFDKKHNLPKEAVKNAVDGGAFVTGIALQTILFKRILAPAFAPPLAGASRKHMEANDAKKAQDEQIVPPQMDAALGNNKEDKKAVITASK